MADTNETEHTDASKATAAPAPVTEPTVGRPSKVPEVPAPYILVPHCYGVLPTVYVDSDVALSPPVSVKKPIPMEKHPVVRGIIAAMVVLAVAVIVLCLRQFVFHG
jgi:hypothetical protein